MDQHAFPVRSSAADDVARYVACFENVRSGDESRRTVVANYFGDLDASRRWQRRSVNVMRRRRRIVHPTSVQIVIGGYECNSCVER